MRLAIPSLILFAYVMASLIWSLPCRPQTKAAAGVVFFVVSLKYLFYEKVFGSFIAPDLPVLLMLCMEMLYSSLLILCFLLIIKDCAAVILWLCRCLGAPWRLPFSSVGRSAGILMIALILSAWGTWQATRVPDVRTVEIRLPHMDKRLNGFSIVQLSDLHIGLLLKKEWLKKVVKKTNHLSPDLVALTGDMIDGYPGELKQDVAPLSRLSAKYGVFGVSGNHEYYFGEKQWRKTFETLGVTMLHNDHKILSGPEGTKLIIAGLPDPTGLRFGGEGPDAPKAFSGTPADAVKVLLAHRPDGQSGNAGADLRLSGHTHGGMLFFLKPLLAHFNGGWVRGCYEVHGTQMYVSPGTGLWAGFSCRLGVPSEITRIVLRP